MAATANKRSKAFSLYDDDDDLPPPPTKKSTVESVEESVSAPTPPTASETDPSKSNEASNGSPSSEQNSVKRKPSDKGNEFILLSAVDARQGERDEMQDAHLLIDRLDLDVAGLQRAAVYGIYDGHAGAKAAKYCEQMIPDLLKKKLSSFGDVAALEKSLKKTFTEVYRAIDDAFLKDARKEKPVWKDGTTATTVLVLNNQIYVANIGDSKAVVARSKEDGTLSAMPLTVDHNPTVYEERQRIQKSGGFVKDGRVNGVIEVSRSIGDGQFKTVGVICAPDMRKLSISEQDRFLIVACDGLWKAFSEQEALTFVDANLSAPPDNDWASLSPSEMERAIWLRAASRLTTEAVKRKCGDNVSVILVRCSCIP